MVANGGYTVVRAQLDIFRDVISNFPSYKEKEVPYSGGEETYKFDV